MRNQLIQRTKEAIKKKNYAGKQSLQVKILNSRLQLADCNVHTGIVDEELEEMDVAVNKDETVEVDDTNDCMEELNYELKYHGHRTCQLLRQNYEFEKVKRKTVNLQLNNLQGATHSYLENGIQKKIELIPDQDMYYELFLPEKSDWELPLTIELTPMEYELFPDLQICISNNSKFPVFDPYDSSTHVSKGKQIYDRSYRAIGCKLDSRKLVVGFGKQEYQKVQFNHHKMTWLRMRQAFPEKVFISIRMIHLDGVNPSKNEGPLTTRFVNITPKFHLVKCPLKQQKRPVVEEEEADRDSPQISDVEEDLKSYLKETKLEQHDKIKRKKKKVE